MSMLQLRGRKAIELDPGRNFVVAAPVASLRVSPGHKVTIYEGPSLGTKIAAPPFYEGWYPHANRNGPDRAKALHDSRRKLVVVEHTNLEAEHLLGLEWEHRSKRSTVTVRAKLPPGEWDARGEAFVRNDKIRRIRVPKNATAIAFEHSNFEGRFTPVLTHDDGAWHDMAKYGLEGKVSSIQFTLDDWKEIKRSPGRSRGKKPAGTPIIREFSLRGRVGRKTEEWVDCGFSESHEEHWDASATLGLSTTIGTGESSPVKVEVTAYAEATAGGGESDSEDKSQNAGTTVEAIVQEEDVDESGIGTVTGSVIFQPFTEDREQIVTFENQRTEQTRDEILWDTFNTFKSNTVFDDDEDEAA